jgi:hypothetical protein
MYLNDSTTERATQICDAYICDVTTPCPVEVVALSQVPTCRGLASRPLDEDAAEVWDPGGLYDGHVP